jgi:CheY-like chemotaxis protein
MSGNKADILDVNKTFLFVDGEPAACASAKRLAGIYGIDVQTANSASVAISLLEHSPNRFFLILTNDAMPGMSGTELLAQVQARWPHIRRALIDSVVRCGTHDLDRAPGNMFRIMPKPMLDQQLKQLLEDACLDFLTEVSNQKSIVFNRLVILEKTMAMGFSDQPFPVFSDFPKRYFNQCQKAWRQAGLSAINITNLDSEAYKKYLSQRCFTAIEKVKGRIKNKSELLAGKEVFMLSQTLRQFDVKGLTKADRYVVGNELLLVLMFSTLKDYYDILGLNMREMVYTCEEFICVSLGGRFTYNDFFNPLLSSVERGVELACLKMEFFMLARLFGVKTEWDFGQNLQVKLLI